MIYVEEPVRFAHPRGTRVNVSRDISAGMIKVRVRFDHEIEMRITEESVARDPAAIEWAALDATRQLARTVRDYCNAILS